MREAKHQAGDRERRSRRGPKKATPEYLEKWALWYLARYTASAAHLRRLLLGKVARSARVHGTDKQDGAAAAGRLIARLTDSGLLDDAVYATARTAGLRRRGASARAIRGNLLQKGVAPELIDQALAALGGESAAPELAAALAYARRRRLGPYRPDETRTPNRERDLAALGRQGFDFDTARQVIDAREVAQLEEEASDRS